MAVGTKTRAELKNEAASKAQALSIINNAANSSNKTVAAAGKKLLATIEAGTLSEEAILSLSSGTFTEDYDFDKTGKWDRFRNSKAWKESVDKRVKNETEIFNTLTETLSARFESGGLKSVFETMQEMSGHVSRVALSNLDSSISKFITTEDKLVRALEYTSPQWHRAAMKELAHFRANLRSYEGAKEVDALLNPKTKNPAAKKAAAKKPASKNAKV